MFAIVEGGAIVRTASTVQKLFNYSVPDGAGIATMSEFMSQMNVKDVVSGERKNEEYYFVTAGDTATLIWNGTHWYALASHAAAADTGVFETGTTD